MVYSNLTVSYWKEARSKFTDEFSTSLSKLEKWMKIYSPLSDIIMICRKEDTELEGFVFVKDSHFRYPIRNIIRLIAKVGTLELGAKIKKFHFLSMQIRCDSFEGEVLLDLTNGNSVKITYTWRWTAFNGKISFDKFTKFDLVET